MKRRQFLAAGSLALTACHRADNAIEGGFTGSAWERGHLLRPESAPAPGAATPPPAVTRRVHTLIAGGGVAGLGGDVEAVVLALKLDQVVLVGHSLGTLIALRMAAISCCWPSTRRSTPTPARCRKVPGWSSCWCVPTSLRAAWTSRRSTM